MGMAADEGNRAGSARREMGRGMACDTARYTARYRGFGRVLATLPVMLAAAATGGAARAAEPVDCFADLMSGTSREIVCTFPVRPGASEREEMAKATRGYFKDAVCAVEIRIERALIRAAIETPDYVFQAPPQPVTCMVTANFEKGEKVYPISGTFAPRVVMKAGEATEATPGLGNIQGVPRPLSWPVEVWVNRGGTTRHGMLQVVNAWLSFMRKQK